MKYSNVLDRLMSMLNKLNNDTLTFVAQQQSPQIWYDRGYFEGCIQRLVVLGYEEQLIHNHLLDKGGVVYQLPTEDRFLPWGKAFLHGMEMGEKEISEVLTENNDHRLSS
ncbi:MAG: hypothetical protein HN826_06705 [Methylococcales bacterium]|jgi:hypothetical protein|nr:hypothetical protein [Methylococcales bacterium]